MSRYKRKIEGLDPERGNELLIRHDQLGLMRIFPRNQAHIALCAYYDWIIGDDEAETAAQIRNTAAKKIFAELVAARKKRVKDYIDKCDKSIPNKYKKKNKVRVGERRLTRVDHIHNTQFSEEVLILPTSSENAVDRRVAGACAESAPASAVNLERHDVPQEEKNETSYAILDALGLLEEED